MPTISVIVPVYNVKEYLDRCFGSIVAQSYSDWECILVDDGSTDGSGQVCDAWASSDSRFQVIHQQNGGVSHARNAGIAAAKGQYLVFCDQDDMLAPQTLEWALAQQAAYPDHLITWPFTREPEEFARQPETCTLGRFARDQMLDYLAGDLFIYIWNKLWPAEVVLKMPTLFDTSLVGGGEDFDFVARFFPLFYTAYPQGGVILLSAPLYFWNLENEKSVSKWGSNYKGYAQKQFAFFNKIKQSFDPFYQQPSSQIAACFNRLLRPVVFGLVTAQQNGEDLAPIWASPELAEMLDWLRQNRWYVNFYFPLRLHCAPLARAMFRWQQEKPALYAKLYWLGYYLLAWGWNRI